MVINAEIDGQGSKRRDRRSTPNDDELRRGRIRRRLEDTIEELRMEMEDLW
jgi:hypothetical protein